MNSKFKAVDERFIRIDEHFDRIESRFDQMESRIELRIDSRFESLNAEIAKMSSSQHNMHLLMEQQAAQNRIVMDGLTSIFAHQDRVERLVTER